MLETIKDGSTRVVNWDIMKKGKKYGTVKIKIQYITDMESKLKEAIGSIEEEISILLDIISVYEKSYNSMEDNDRSASFDGGYLQPLIKAK